RLRRGRGTSAGFASTSWTLILEAGGTESSDQTRDALTQLCSIYWRPVYLFLRRRDYNWHDAEDLTQGFLVDLIETRFHIHADPDKGRFRSFLLGALKNFLANRKDYEHAQKRGRDVNFVPLTEVSEQEVNEMVARYYRWNAEESYEREWAVVVLRRAITLLDEECRLAGKNQLFHALKGYLGAEGIDVLPYEEISRQLSRSVVALRKDVSRFRQRYRSILREEVRQTVASENEVDAELRHLCAVMAR
ncbi:MAG: sigma-70 family RNA polymerase sigma factor, partial [Chthoniobacterales bacterium]